MQQPNQIPRSKPLAVTGVLLLSAPLFSSIFTVIAMLRAFEKLRIAGAADPSALAGDISFALYGTMLGLVFG